MPQDIFGWKVPAIVMGALFLAVWFMRSEDLRNRVLLFLGLS